MPATTEIRRAADRFVTKTSWLTSRHSFSFADHYDPANTHHGLLLVNNDDIVAPAAGFDTHPHRDMEIVTWVLHGALAHRDSTGNHGVIYPGLAQRMSAGSGILHSEKNDSPTAPVRFIQMWVLPDETGIAPGYQQHEIDDEALTGSLTPIVSGMSGHDAAITLHNRNAALHAARLGPSHGVDLPPAPYLHLYVTRGQIVLEGIGDLYEGDAVRFTASDGHRITATEPAEILVWEMHARLGG
ncbi:pirin family protein [Mycobacterium heckeshornense]|uniref:Putative quercetin 2,3-dioxygenase n=1 Tax=Mycobacterium heckeshornense TaxID=110505 RepID=A0A2I3EWV1_9MYCO|nr:pirin-like bicupin family protein [Mycobacterium heckeshornense]KMV23474.1 quercetin 2,3-dioxygenase [Mycobacterium heckeshornense]MCV7033140.1 pirin family protein [Mycobacterium heckeshornense]BCO38234.1 putative quercetin 2,3-dioxygenase [Mycobacterium heckeshornense]